MVSDSAHSLVPEVARGITVDFGAPGAAFSTVLDGLGDEPVACVLATDDVCVTLANRIAAHYGLAHNRPEAARLTQRKDLGRAALARAGCNTPAFQVVAFEDADPRRIDIDFPLVVKPLSLSGSRGVIRVDDPAQFVAARDRVRAIVEHSASRGYAADHLLLEEYLDGDEYAIEGFMIAGRFQPLTIFDKPEPLTGPYFEETYYVTPSRLPAPRRRALIDEVARCCAAYGLSQGPVHAEARLTARGPVLLELAARTIGGQCGQLIEFSLGHPLEELVILGLCDRLPPASGQTDAAGVLMIPITEAGILHRVEGLTDALQTPWVRDVEIHIAPGYELRPLPEGSSYLGFIFAQGPDPETTYRALRAAHARLRFVTRPRWRLESG